MWLAIEMASGENLSISGTLNETPVNDCRFSSFDRFSTEFVISPYIEPCWSFLKRNSGPEFNQCYNKEKIFPTEQCKNYENRIKNKEVMTFWNFMFFPKTLLDQSLWIFKWANWWCHPLTIFYWFHIQIWQKSHISAMKI